MIEFKPFQGVRGAFLGKNPSQFFPLVKDYLLLKQVHGELIRVLKTPEDFRQIHLQEGDALLCRQKNIPIAVKTADCVPILMAHPAGLIGAVHAGWRGTKLKILEKVLLKIRNEFKLDLSKIHMAIGPAICAKCYEVREEVAREFAGEYIFEKENGKFLLDLKRMNFDLARELGVPKNQMEVLADCTLCDKQRYYSFRHESQQGLNKEGRNYSWVMWV